jgi:hypothetical protein
VYYSEVNRKPKHDVVSNASQGREILVVLLIWPVKETSRLEINQMYE